MFPAKTIIVFVVRFALVFGLLIAPWPGLEEGYAKLFQGSAQLLFHKFGSKGLVFVQPHPQPSDPILDTRVLVANRDLLKPGGSGPAGSAEISSRYLGYLPTSLVLALILASPMPWKRRAWVLSCSLLLINCFIGFLVWLIILNQYSVSSSVSFFVLGPFMQKVLNSAYEVFVTYAGANYVVPVLIWIALSHQWRAIQPSQEPVA